MGEVVEVLVEEARGRGLRGRARDQAPAIDGAVQLRGQAAPGDLVLARVTGADTYDLRADIVDHAVDMVGSPP